MGKNFTIEETGLPNLPQMMLATLNALKEIGDSANIREIAEQIAEMESVTEEEQSFMQPNGQQSNFTYYLGWARTYLRRGGALENPARSIWTLTDKGKNITSVEETRAIEQQVRAEERDRRKAKRAGEKGQEPTDSPSSEEQPLELLDSDQDAPWKKELLDVLQKMPPPRFRTPSKIALDGSRFYQSYSSWKS